MRIPTLSTIARNQTQSAAPNLWNGLCGLWMPGVGRQGDRLFDLSGNGGHGTQSGMSSATAWVDGPYGPALRFDGNDDKVVMPINPALEAPTVAITCIYWGTYSATFQSNSAFLDKPFSGNPYHAYHFNRYSYSDWINFGLATDGSGLKDTAYIYFNTATPIAAGQPFVAVGRWGGHLGSTIKLDAFRFLTKALFDSKTNTATGTLRVTTRPVQLGEGDGPSNSGGDCYGAWVYNRCLTDQEVQSILYDPYAQLRRREVQQYFDIGAAAGLNPAIANYYRRMMAE